MSDDTPDAAKEAPGDTPEGGHSANKEAAAYRVKLRDAESKLQAAEERITGLLRSAIETRAEGKLSVPADLFEIGKVGMQDLLDPAGNPDGEAINAAIETLLKERPGLSPTANGWGDVGAGARPQTGGSTGPTWASVLRS